MKELKNQPIDARAKKPFFLRAALACLLFPCGTAVCCLVMRSIAQSAGYEEHIKRLCVVIIIVAALMFVRYLYRCNIRKWCCAYMNFVQDCFAREDVERCPRCNTAFGGVYGESERKKQCPNKNCALSADEKIRFGRLPATVNDAKALVLNAGVRDDFKFSVAKCVFQTVAALVVYAVVAVTIVYFIIPQIARLVKEIIDLL